MASLTPGSYVIVQVQPNGWNSMDDGDLTDDGDIVDNTDSLDNIIPVTVDPSEIDLINYFKESPVPGNITGHVFNDFDGDQVPDPGEGMENVMICLFPDTNADGQADTLVPFATQFTSGDGSYTFSNIAVGHYVMCEIQPGGYYSIRDIDISNDNDLVPNTNLFNDTIPVTLTNAETDEHNYFIDTDSCGLVVNNTNDAGPGSFRAALACASSGDTIRFNSSLSGQTINITSYRMVIDKNLVIYGDVEPRVILSSQITGFFEIGEGIEATFRMLDIVSGLSGNIGAAFNNEGLLIFENTLIRRNPLLPIGDYLIYNMPDAELIFEGNCMLNTE
jgi:hypothetical protein